MKLKFFIKILLLVGLNSFNTIYSITRPNSEIPKILLVNNKKPDDDTTYKILNNFAASVADFGQLIRDPDNPENVKGSLCNIAGHWVKILAEATRLKNKNILSYQDQLDIDNFVNELEPEAKNKLLSILIYLYTDKCQSEIKNFNN